MHQRYHQRHRSIMAAAHENIENNAAAKWRHHQSWRRIAWRNKRKMSMLSSKIAKIWL